MTTTERHEKRSAEKTARDIRRATRRRYSVGEKIRIVLVWISTLYGSEWLGNMTSNLVRT